MYIYLFAAFLIMAPLLNFFSGSRQNSKDVQPSPGDRQNSSGGMNSGQRDLCEVSGHDHFFRPSLSHPLIHLLTLPVGGSYLAKLGLWQTTEARGEQRFRSSILRKNLCTSPPTEVQVPGLQSIRQVCVQRILWTWTRQVISLFLPSSTHDSLVSQRRRSTTSCASMRPMQETTPSCGRLVLGMR